MKLCDLPSALSNMNAGDLLPIGHGFTVQYDLKEQYAIATGGVIIRRTNFKQSIQETVCQIWTANDWTE